MDPITAALVAGAALAFKDVASDAVKSAYNGLKGLLSGKISSLATLEKDPSKEAFRNAAAAEVELSGVGNDPVVIEKAKALTEVIAREPAERLAAADIDVGQIRAAGEVLVARLEAAGDVRVKDIQSTTGAVRIADIKAGKAPKG